MRPVQQARNVLDEIKGADEIEGLIAKWDRFNNQIGTFDVLLHVVPNVNSKDFVGIEWILRLLAAPQIKRLRHGLCSRYEQD